MSSDSRSGGWDDPYEREIDVPVHCVLTRFGLRSSRHLAPTYRDYRRLVQEADRVQVPGLLRSAFLVENPRTCYTLSLWSQEPMMSAPVPAHVEAARRVFGRLSLDPERGPELCSTTWRLNAVTNNLNWDGLDLDAVLEGGRAT
ncbi:MAG: hypothetical protein ACJ768_06400 [Gaiellaceae bacterium]